MLDSFENEFRQVFPDVELFRQYGKKQGSFAVYSIAEEFSEELSEGDSSSNVIITLRQYYDTADNYEELRDSLLGMETVRWNTMEQFTDVEEKPVLYVISAVSYPFIVQW